MNVPVEVKSGLKQLKKNEQIDNKYKVFVCNRCGAEYVSIEGETIGCCVTPVEYRTSGICGGELIIKDNNPDYKLKSRFVYNVCGYHHTPIPSQLSPKLEFAHPSPLVRLLSVCKRLLSTDNLLLMVDKVTRLIRCVYSSMYKLISIQAVHVSNNTTNEQSETTSTNGNNHDNECNLQSINIDNLLYDNKLSNCTHD